jgi:hypothetical protein
VFGSERVFSIPRKKTTKKRNNGGTRQRREESLRPNGGANKFASKEGEERERAPSLSGVVCLFVCFSARHSTCVRREPETENEIQRGTMSWWDGGWQSIRRAELYEAVRRNDRKKRVLFLSFYVLFCLIDFALSFVVIHTHTLSFFPLFLFC